MNRILYTLTLEEPILASGLDGEPNSAQSLPYIPGGAVRGAFIQAFSGKMDAEGTDFRRLFLNGDTCYLNAYPLVNGERALPTPRTWQVERKPAKDANKKVYRQAPDGLDTKNASFAFWTIENASLNRVDIDWQVNVHTLRDAKLGRSTSEAGAVYRYVALPAGMQLQGAILAQSLEDANKLKDSLHGKTILLGKARTAGYGAAKIELKEISGDWYEWKSPGDLTGSVSLTLLSPAIVRDASGQYSLDPTTALKACLDDSVEVEVVQRHSVLIGGFNRAWGLPLPQMTAIAAGSVFTITGASRDKLKQLAQIGFGERRAEGFGRVALNLDLPSAEMPLVDIPIILVSPQASSLPADDPQAKQMLERLMRRDLDEQVIRVARSLTSNYKGGLPNSQLSRWRVILRDALPGKDVNRVIAFCEKAKGKPGWKKMEKVRLSLDGGNPRLTEWIESLLAGDKDWQGLWEAHFKRSRKIGSTALSSQALADEYRLRLMDAVLAVLSKQNNSSEGEGGANG